MRASSSPLPLLFGPFSFNYFLSNKVMRVFTVYYNGTSAFSISYLNAIIAGISRNTSAAIVRISA